MTAALASALAHAARVLVRSVLRVAPGEHVAIVEDDASSAIGAAIAAEADALGAWVKRPNLDHLTYRGAQLDRASSAPAVLPGRPHRALPEPLFLAMLHAQVSVFVASALHQEAPVRQALLHLATERDGRHAHLPGISLTSFLSGMAIDYGDVERVGEEVLALAEDVETLVTDSPAGTHLEIRLPSAPRWVAQLGDLQPGRWANLPAGALYTSPLDVRGVFVADASLGEFFGAREGLLGPRPARFFVERGRVVRVEASAALQRDLEAMLAVSANSNRVGLVAVGVNHGIVAPVGEAALDQNFPGLHLGIGDPAGSSTGATWTAPTCFAACQAASTVSFGREVIIREGRFVGRLASYASRATRSEVRAVTPRSG